MQIKTNSAIGTFKEVSISFYTEDLVEVGYLGLYFSDPMQYILWPCGYWAYISTTIPAEENKVWTLIKTRTLTATSLTIHCNDVKIVEMVLPNCSERCVSLWNYNMQKIYFYSDYDTASVGYREAPKSSGILHTNKT